MRGRQEKLDKGSNRLKFVLFLVKCGSCFRLFLNLQDYPNIRILYNKILLFALDKGSFAFLPVFKRKVVLMNFIFTNILLSIVYEDDNLWFICGHVDICMESTAANFTVNNNIACTIDLRQS